MPSKDMTAVLFRNNKKKSDNAPDYTGSAKVEGKEYRLAAWVRKSEKAGQYLSIAINVPQMPELKKEDTEIEEDDLPF